jgi:hypothetical protein
MQRYFYALNYRILVIRISTEGLQLKFGLFGWTVPWHTVAEAYPDETSLVCACIQTVTLVHLVYRVTDKIRVERGCAMSLLAHSSFCVMD